MIFSKKSFCLLILTFLACIAYRCAQVVPLTGGAKDAKPPELVSVVPANQSINIPTSGTKIVFKFNEMIAAPTASQNLIINPLTDEMPDITARGKTLTVEFTKELKQNTTYLLQFGNSVTDIHENNPFPNLTYIFSTGPSIDTSSISGQVINALSQKPATDVNIMLYKNLSDTAPLRSKPDYMTKVNEKGNYFLSAVKPGTYQAIALSDKSKNLMYDAGEAIGFLDSAVSVNNDTVNFMMSVAKPENVFVKKKNQIFWGYHRFILNDTLPNVYMITSKSVDADNISFETRNDTLEVYYKNLYNMNLELWLKKDKITFDTINLTLPSKAKTDSSYDKGIKKISFHTGKTTYGTKHDEVVLNFSIPVKSIDAEKCFLIRDSIKEKPVFTSEKKNEEKTLVTTYFPQYKKRLTNNLIAQKTYTLLFLPQSVETFWGTFNKDTIKTTFKTFPMDEIGNLQIKLTLTDSIRAYVLQLLNANGTVVNELTAVNKKETILNFYNLSAGEYSLRLIEDTDENKKFTPSNFLKHTQAEPVWYYNKPLKILAGWDIEAEWDMKNPQKK
jgi:hypothetical protein